MPRRRVAMLCIGLPLVTAGLGLMLQSPWTDEIFTLKTAAKDGLGFSISAGLGVHVLPIYPLFVYFFSLAGTSLLGARILSLLAFMGSAYGLFSIGRRLSNERAATLATLLFAFHPLMVWYAQEARMYMLGLCFSLAALALLLRYQDEGRKRDLVLFALAFLLGSLNHLYFACVAVAISAAVLLRGPNNRRIHLLATMAACYVIAAPIIWVMITRSADIHPGFEKVVDWKALAYAALGMSTGYGIGPTVAELHAADPMAAMKPHLREVVTLLLCFWTPVCFAAFFMWFIFKARRVLLILAPLAIVPVLLPFAIATISPSVSFNVRYVLVAVPAVLLVLSIFITTRDHDPSSWRWGLLPPMLYATIMGFGMHYLATDHWKEDYRGVTSFLRTELTDNTIFLSPEQGNFEYLLNRPREDIIKLTPEALQETETAHQPRYVVLMRPWVNDPKGEIQNYLNTWKDAKTHKFHQFTIYELPVSATSTR